MNMTAEQLSALFPELALIQNRDLREKTVQVWLQACQDCDWDSLEEIPFSAGFTPTPDNLVYHTRLAARYSYAVAQQSNQLQKTQVDLDIIVAGALLHDVCKVAEYSKAGGKTAWGNGVTHGIYGICLCHHFGLPMEIIHIIASHTEKLGMPTKSLEAIIIRHCDEIAASGSYLLSRHKTKSGGKWVDL